MGCCSSYPLPLHQRQYSGESDDLPPLRLQKTKRKEELKFSTANFIFRVHERLTLHYNVEKKIGEGGYGTVWRAVHKPSGQRRAIKSLTKGKMSHAQEEQMAREVGLLKTLVRCRQDHPNILKIFEVVEDDRNFHIITELCTGGDLFDRVIGSCRLSECVVATYMQQILSAVSYCHDLHIVHRDLKPENLLLLTQQTDSLLKVIDFGTSSKLRPTRQLRNVIGTVYYMAPEVIDGMYNEKCDIWSCGVVLYILLCGYPPFNGNCDEEIKERILQAEPLFLGEEWLTVSEGAIRLIKRMLVRDPRMRPGARELMEDPWLVGRVMSGREDTRLKSTVLQNMKRFRSGCKFRQATLHYIAWQFVPPEETDALKRIFISLDSDNDGRLSRKDLEINFKTTMPTALDDIDHIMASIDCDGNGYIDFHEFLIATLNWKQILTKEVLENAFEAFDTDGNGKIEVGELKFMLEGDQDVDSGVWTDVLQEADSDGNGAVLPT